MFFQKLLFHRKRVLFITLFLGLIVTDIVLSDTKAGDNPLAVDSYFFESGYENIDGYTSASIATHVALIRSSNPSLSFSKGKTANLTHAEIREMVYLALKRDTHFGSSNISELKYKIDNKVNQKGSAWVSIMPNICYLPNATHYMPGDQTDPRVIWAVLDYIADSTDATRISLLAGGTYAGYSDERDVFDLSSFDGQGWNRDFPDLPSDFTFNGIVQAAQDRHPDKTIECINTNYNEIMSDGRPYNEISVNELDGLTPQIYPVPNDPKNITSRIGGGLPTSNTMSDNGYNPSDAVRNCDILVNVPIIKTTPDVVSNCIQKNYIGSVSRGVYAEDGGSTYPHNRSLSLSRLDHGNALPNTVANLFAYHPSDYCIVDGIASLEGEGSHPWSYRTGFLRRNFLLAGSDPIAAEAVAVASMNLNPADIELLRWGQAKGYGVYDLRRIAVYGDPLDSVRVDFKAPAKHVNAYTYFKDMHYYGRGCRRWLVHGPYASRNIREEFIDETAADPRPNDEINGLAWTPFYSASNYIDLQASVTGADFDHVVYAFTQIYSDKAQTGKLYLGAIRDLRVRVNGTLVIDSATFLSYGEVDTVVDISLNQGDNRILVKAHGTNSGAGFSLAVVNDGTLSNRNIYLPYAAGYPATSDVYLTSEMKRSFFGGRTLAGTFYHLGQSEPDAVELAQPASELPQLTLSNSPNPFYAETRIFFGGNQRTSLSLDVFDASGRLVNRLIRSEATQGMRYVTWKGTDLSGKPVPNGIYFCKLVAGHGVKTIRMIHLR